MQVSNPHHIFRTFLKEKITGAIGDLQVLVKLRNVVKLLCGLLPYFVNGLSYVVYTRDIFAVRCPFGFIMPIGIGDQRRF